MSRRIETAETMSTLPVGSTVALFLPNGEVMNVGLKTEPDNWALAGQTRKYTTSDLFRNAYERDGCSLGLLE